jgi:hypothetical protein
MHALDVDRWLLPDARVSLVQHESFEAELVSAFQQRVVLVLGQIAVVVSALVRVLAC